MERKTMIRGGYILGIDPDISKSGLALLDCGRREIVYASALAFPDAVRYLDWLATQENARVVIEDSWNATHNWHLYRMSTAKASAIGRSVGMCHAAGMLLEQMARDRGLDVTLMKPLKKCWKGADGKITQAEIVQFVRGMPTRCNQEVRDAALLAWCFAGLPVRLISPAK